MTQSSSSRRFVAVGAERLVAHQHVDERMVERDEQAAAHDRGHRALEHLADAACACSSARYRSTTSRSTSIAARSRVLAAVAADAQVFDRRAARVDLAAAQHVLHGPVHDEIRVAADRRGEVQVRVRRQAEVPDVDDVVLGLLHRAQQQHLQHLLLRVVLDALQATARRRVGIERGRRCRTSTPSVCATSPSRSSFCLVGLAVDAIDGRTACACTSH